MVLFDGFAGLLFLGLWIFCIIDVITTPEARCRNLPKVVWLLIVILLIDFGSIAWLLAGRAWAARADQRVASKAGARPGTKPRASNPDDDDEFLASLQARAEEQRRRARETQPRPDDDPGKPTN
jgi:hypothetical protein